MTPFLNFLIVLSLTPAFVFILHAFFVRVFSGIVKGASNQSIAVWSIIAGYIPMAFALWHVYIKGLGEMSEALFSALFALIVYSALAYSYFHVFNMSETARRIKILREIHLAGRISREELARGYNANEMIKARLERLERLGQIRLTGGRYVLAGRLFYMISRAMEYWACLIGLPLSGKNDRR